MKLDSMQSSDSRLRIGALLSNFASIVHQFGGRSASGDGKAARFAHPPDFE
jgi:hypothetical protein